LALSKTLKGPFEALFSMRFLTPKAGHLWLKDVQLRNREVGSKTGRMMLGFFVFEALVEKS
jgi:hypothetical protein